MISQTTYPNSPTPQQGAESPELFILSPHLDDAVYSCWGAIRDQTTVVTVFAGPPQQDMLTPWDELTGFRGAHEAIAARIEENQAALGSTGCNIVNLPFLDLEYRLRQAEEDAVDPASLFLCLDSFIPPSSHILAPASYALGRGHPDHELVRDASILLARSGRSVLFYADFPYAVNPDNVPSWDKTISRQKVESVLGTTCFLNVQELDLSQQEAKRQAVQAYTSQTPLINGSFGNVFDNPAAYEHEIIFVPSRLPIAI